MEQQPMTTPKWTKLDEYKVWLEALALSLETEAVDENILMQKAVYLAKANGVRMALNKLEMILDQDKP